MTDSPVSGALVTILVLALAACGSTSSTDAARAETLATASTAVDTTDLDVASSSSSPADIVTSDGTSESDANQVVNEWIGPPADLTSLPIGTPHVSTTGVAMGNLYVCDPGNPNGPGAFAVGEWIDEAAGTWSALEKVVVQGEVSWPMASYSETTDGDSRVITTNGLPVDTITGTFPIAAGDPAYVYDRNPNAISESEISVTLPLVPTIAERPACLPKGAIGVLENGVALFAPVDERNRDAVAYETQDECDGHPQQTSTYHYHSIPSCIVNATTGPSTVVGYAYDGFPIVVERDASGNLPTNIDLDECHGRTSEVVVDGVTMETYHYSATWEFPYFIGCFVAEPTN
jgi:hypothetical protein